MEREEPAIEPAPRGSVSGHAHGRVRGLVLSTGVAVPDFELANGLNLVHVSRENSATVLALTLAGRMKPKAGEVILGGAALSMKERFRAIALAGAREIDALERLVSVHVVVREQLAWSEPFYKLTPRNLDRSEKVKRAFARVGLDMDDALARRTKVGEMKVGQRLLLRTALALIARPEAQLLIVDDIDQLRSFHLRTDYLKALQNLDLPVLAVSANGDDSGLADQVIRIAGDRAGAAA